MQTNKYQQNFKKFLKFIGSHFRFPSFNAYTEQNAHASGVGSNTLYVSIWSAEIF